MSIQFAQVPLAHLLKQSDMQATILPEQSYRLVTVKLWGKGVELRSEVDGASIMNSKLFVVREQQFILSRIDARNGAFGLIPASLDHAVVSSDFPVFTLNTAKVFPAYLNWMSKTADFVQLCAIASEGTTNRVRLKVDRFLASTIPLPPLQEQRRIVARIEELVGRIEEARGLRKGAAEERGTLLDSSIITVFQSISSVKEKSLKALTSKIGSGSTPSGGRHSYLSSGIPFIRSQNVRMRQFIWDGIAYIDEITHQHMSNTKVRPNDVLLNITGASIGRVACAPENLLEANVNQHVAIIRPVESLQPRFLMYWLSQPMIQSFINDEQKGATRQGFTKAQIENLSIPLLSREEQNAIVSYLDGIQAQVERFQYHQAETASELDALLPSILDKAFKGEL